MSSPTKKPEQKYKTVHVGSLAEEFAKNDDIVDYIQDTSLERLKSKYGEAEEDVRIREGRSTPNGEKTPQTHSHSSKKVRHDILDSPTVTAPISKFQTAKSRYDNDSVLFGDIKLEEKEEKSPKVNETTKPKRRGRPPKEKPVEEPVSSMTEKFNTNTRVIFVDSQVEDGIKRTDELEVSSVFEQNQPKKRKNFFRR